MRVTSAQRAQILYLCRVEGVRAATIAEINGLSYSTIKGMLHKAGRQDMPVVAKDGGDAPLVAGSHRESDTSSPGLLAASLRDELATTADAPSKGGHDDRA